MVERMLMPAGPPPGEPEELKLKLGASEQAWAEAALDGVACPVIIHPGTSADWKIWSLNSFKELVVGLAGAGFSPVIVGGPGEAEQGAALANHCPAATNLTGATSIGRLLALLKRAALFIGGDHEE